MSQTNALRVVAELPGSALKWIYIAETEFQRRSFNLDHYIVSVLDRQGSVVVMLAALNPMPPATGDASPASPPYPPVPQVTAPGALGNTGSLPGYEVEISKQQMKVLRSNFVR